MIDPSVLFWVFTSGSIFCLLLFSGLISGSEVAYFSLRPKDIKHYDESKSASAKAVMALMADPHTLLASVLILNNLVNIAIVTISTFMLWEMISSVRSNGAWVGVVTLITTFCITFFGEIVPKTYAATHYHKWVSYSAHIWLLLVALLKPFAKPLMYISQFVERRVKRKGYSATVDQLNQALELSFSSSASDVERVILKGILNFSTRTVRQVIKARIDIFAIPIDISFSELLKHVSSSQYSRIPVYRETLDHIEGILYMKDLIPYIDEADSFDWQKLLRPVFFVPITKRLNALLSDFQVKHVHMAIVVDEYGGTTGLVTLEDLVEEIVGEIDDEFDQTNVLYQKVNAHIYIFEGKTPIHLLCKAFSVDSRFFDDVRGDHESIGGLILELHQYLPRPGVIITFKSFSFTVLDADDRRIIRIKVSRDQNL